MIKPACLLLLLLRTQSAADKHKKMIEFSASLNRLPAPLAFLAFFVGFGDLSVSPFSPLSCAWGRNPVTLLASAAQTEHRRDSTTIPRHHTSVMIRERCVLTCGCHASSSLCRRLPKAASASLAWYAPTNRQGCALSFSSCLSAKILIHVATSWIAPDFYTVVVDSARAEPRPASASRPSSPVLVFS